MIRFSLSSLQCTCDLPESPAWANALVGRIFWDFLRERLWSDAMSRKIQKKLSRIHVSSGCSERETKTVWYIV